MEYKTVICVDTSGSTYGNIQYYNKIKSILNLTNEKLIISWNQTAKITESEEFDSSGGTYPQTFLNIIKDFNYEYNLIVTTDGLISDSELTKCREIISSSNILSQIKSFKIYFIGTLHHMNLKISSLFNQVEQKEIIINEDEAIQVLNIDLNYLTLSDFQNEKNLIASVLSLIQLYPHKKQEFRAQICQASNRLIAQLATKMSIAQFYETNDIDGCVEFVKKFDNCNKKQLQQSVSKILTIFDSQDDYSLSHLANTIECKEQEIETDGGNDNDDDDVIADGDFICDILYVKCNLPCILIKFFEDVGSENIDKYSVIPDKLSKKISENPFLILNHDEIIKKIIRRVDHQIIDLQAYNKLENKSVNPFTRQDVKGAFIFHNDAVDYNLLFKNNNRALSFMFGENNKLPGNKAIWNVLFLYILIKHHPVWKEYETKLKEEIKYIFENIKTFITFTPLLNPSIIENLGVCLWYTCLVSPRAFENTSSNVLRFMEGSEKLLEFSSYISGKKFEDIINKIKIWNLWKYFVRNKVNKYLKVEVLSQIQNHEMINNSVVLFSGRSNCNKNQSECECKQYDVKGNVAIKLYNILEKKLQPKLYDDIDFDAIYKEDNELLYKTIEINPKDELLLEHITICLTTCKPTVICPVTGKHWKECAGEYDVKKESYLRLFKTFCSKKMKYPNDENELLEFHSNRINSDLNDLIIYPVNAKQIFKRVMDKYTDIMKRYSIEEYVKISNENCDEKTRIELEKTCNKCFETSHK
ncbi:hypothetical protein ILUMI_04654 [Ignelater luminosus]|uniref:Uncharacterized protein n=1 Tax=Ignelater luminosus TaxID=2038154 RepID=A0A8K0DE23_IGNLU|nr:hypothetical protein ILUMI_04654 [Ignelater luminosus]